MNDHLRAIVALNDPILRPFIEAEDEASRDAELERLVNVRARSTIHGVVARSRRDGLFAEDEVGDVVAAVILRLLPKLRVLRSSEDEAVRQFDNYVARLAYNTVNDIRRRRYPERTRLKRRIRYVLSRDPQFSIWETPAGPLCGLAAWRDSTDSVPDLSFDRSEAPPALFRADKPQDALLVMFEIVGRPMDLDLLTSALVELWQIQETPVVHLSASTASVGDQGAEYESRELLRIVWEEMQSLPENQRIAILLNLRDAFGLSAMPLFPLTGIATFEEVAAAVGYSPQTLAEVWNRLPLPDLEIADSLELSRQQIINLRKSGRERLARRLNARHQGSRS